MCSCRLGADGADFFSPTNRKAEKCLKLCKIKQLNCAIVSALITPRGGVPYEIHTPHLTDTTHTHTHTHTQFKAGWTSSVQPHSLVDCHQKQKVLYDSFSIAKLHDTSYVIYKIIVYSWKKNTKKSELAHRRRCVVVVINCMPHLICS